MQTQKIKMCKKIQKCKIISQGGAEVKWGVQKEETKKGQKQKKPKTASSSLSSIPVHISELDSVLAHACMKSKTYNMKLIAFLITIPTISIL